MGRILWHTCRDLCVSKQKELQIAGFLRIDNLSFQFIILLLTTSDAKSKKDKIDNRWQFIVLNTLYVVTCRIKREGKLQKEI